VSETTGEHEVVPKLCGADVELGSFRPGAAYPFATDDIARALLREIDGLPGDSGDSAGVYLSSSSAPSSGGFRIAVPAPGLLYACDSQDWGRKFLPSNGGCVYIDLGHLELCQPEVLSAFDHVAAWHAMLRIARCALDKANRHEPASRRITVLVNNSDGHGNSYGSHLSFLVTRRAWDNLFRHKLHQLIYLASYQASAIVFTGAGKVGSENGVSPVAYQLSQRADFIETLTGAQTTYQRPLVNSRDEALCGAGGTLARLHVIFFDSTLCHVASLLKVGVMQIVLAMIEADQIAPGLLLDNPLQALRDWSRDPSLRARANTVAGERLTAVELQQRFLDEAKRFAEGGGFDRVVPRARDILELWGDTLRLLEQRDFAALAPRLDWVLKMTMLERVLRSRADLDWGSPQIKHLDHMYSSLDESDGLYWAFERDGLTTSVASNAEIERRVSEPPEDTRAWTRAMLLRSVERGLVEEVNWDVVRIRAAARGARPRIVSLSNPLAGTRDEMAHVFTDRGGMDDVIEALALPAAGAPA
jgi:proteasome accessory factor A